jgi:hypothetical protein
VKSPRRNSMVTVTFCAAPPPEAPTDSTLYVMGSLPSLGSWDTLRARKMIQKDDVWELTLSVPEAAEFLYQIVLLAAPHQPDGEPRVIWQGALEKRSRDEMILGIAPPQRTKSARRNLAAESFFSQTELNATSAAALDTTVDEASLVQTRRRDIRAVSAGVQCLRAAWTETRVLAETLCTESQTEITAACNQMVACVSATASRLEARARDALERLQLEAAERRRLHNVVQDLRGSVRVVCRTRPGAASRAVRILSDTELLVSSGGGQQRFAFDEVFSMTHGQERVYAACQPLVVSVLDGYHACIFAYGQTGSGKTYTMQGEEGVMGDVGCGVNGRALRDIFELAATRSSDADTAVHVSLIEIYNEGIRDLLEPTGEDGEEKRLDVKPSPDGGTCIPGALLLPVGSVSEVEAAMARGGLNRSVAGTDMNAHSSRSHMVLTVTVHATPRSGAAPTLGKLHLVDLAGSERLSRSGAQGERLREAQNINRSLSALGDCVQSLVSKSKHVPFRNSKLTHLLQDSLGGDSKTLMILCISPEDADASETTCALHFAARVKNVVLGPAWKRQAAAGVGGTQRDAELVDVRRACDVASASAAQMEARALAAEREVARLRALVARGSAGATKDAGKSAPQLWLDAETEEIVEIDARTEFSASGTENLEACKENLHRDAVQLPQTVLSQRPISTRKAVAEMQHATEHQGRLASPARPTSSRRLATTSAVRTPGKSGATSARGAVTTKELARSASNPGDENNSRSGKETPSRRGLAMGPADANVATPTRAGAAQEGASGTPVRFRF